MRFSEEFLDELKSRIRLSDVIGRKVKLKRQGKDLVGLSPFSSEKTPSFHVHDDKGFYKCFSTQKGGNAITFLMETERLSFTEAVEKLAADAGMELPKGDPREAQEYRKRATLQDWAERACQFFEDQLRAPAGAEAQAYLDKRGFGKESWTRHRMGFAPDAWRGLSDHLTRQGATIPELIEAGLLVEPEGGKQPWDRFRNRVIFPIADPSGKVIAFGARTLDPDGKPKYLNSSDGPLFHKGRVLYRYGAAREALAQVRDGALSRGLIVTEGYVDAIALAEAGIGTAVAPLGTALTEDQLELLWRAGPEPILCFDGDAAGQRAAYRALDRALPMIDPERTLYFVLLPESMDPDDVVRVRGPQAMRDMLGGAQPLVDLLWKREVEAEPLDTPERRASLEARLMDAVGKIRHAGVKKAYERELRDRLYWSLRPSRPPQGKPGQPWKGQSGQGYQAPRPGASAANLAAAGRIRGLGLLVRAIESPGILEQGREAATRAGFDDADVTSIRDAAFHVLDHAEMLDRATVAAHLRTLGRKRAVELLESMPVRPPIDPRSAEGRDWLHALERFPVAGAMVGEARTAIQAEEGGAGMMSASHEARIKAMVLDRRRASRSVVEETVTSSAGDGVQELRDAVGGLGVAVEQRHPEDKGQ